MSLEKNKHADSVIRNHSIWSLASGAIPVVLADMAAVSAVQIDMIRQLCDVYDVDFSKTSGKALVSSLTSAVLARVSAASLVKLVPVAGSIVGSISGGVLAGASTYALGQAFKTHLSAGGTFLDFDIDRLKAVYREQFEKGKDIVQEWGKEYQDSSEEQSESSKSKGSFFFDKLVRKAKNKQTEEVKQEHKEKPEKAKKAAKPVAVEKEDVSSDNDELSQRFERLANLRKRDLITEEEYQEAKKQLLKTI